MKRKKTPEAKTPKAHELSPPPPVSSAELNARIAVWEARKRDLTEQIIQLEHAGTLPPTNAISVSDEARALLEGREIKAAPIGEPQARLAALHRERNIVTKALAMADDRMRFALAVEAGQRYEAHKPAYSKAFRRLILAALEIEHALQELDGIAAEIQPVTPMAHVSWPLLGRLENNASQCSRLCVAGVTDGHLSKVEFNAELKRCGAKY